MSKSGRVSKRTRTRALLVHIATDLFQAHGISKTSLAQVATAAGMSKGAIYSNFASKDDLVVAVVMAQELNIKPRIDPDMTVAQILEAVGTATAELIAAADSKAQLICEYLLYAATNEPLRAQVAETFAQRTAQLAARLAQSKPATRMTARELVLACEALITGFVVQRVVMQNKIDDSEIVAAFSALAR